MAIRSILVGASLFGIACAHEREGITLPGHDLQAAAASGLLQLDWESRYSSEGRDNLTGDSILTQRLEYCWEDLCFGVWRAESDNQRYEELQMGVAYGRRWNDLEVSIGYTHLRFPEGGPHDHELGLGLVWDGGPLGIEFALDAYHSIEAAGHFVEGTVSRSWELSQTTSLELAGAVGMNQGYIADGHDGANHASLRLGLSRELGESITLHVHGTWNQALDRDRTLAGDDALRNFFHGGIGLEWRF